MAKSWSNPITIGYEIKVSRSDFLKDSKWRSYLPYCNEFYFVCPPGIIDKSEVPEEAGLFITSVNARRLYCKKKAPFRDVNIPEAIFRYILMARVQVTDEWKWDSVEYWRRWLKKRDEEKELGWNVSNKIQNLVSERISEVEKKNKALKRKIEALEPVEKKLKEMDIDSLTYSSTWRLEQALEDLRNGVPRNFVHTLDRAIGSLTDLREYLEKQEDHD